MAISLTGKIILNGLVEMSSAYVDPFAGDVKFLATFETNFNNTVTPFSAPTVNTGLVRQAGAGQDGSYALDVTTTAYMFWTRTYGSSAASTTYEVWAKKKTANSVGEIFVVDNSTPTVATEVGMHMNTNGFWLYTGGGGNGGTNTLGAYTNDTEWHHYAMVYNHTDTRWRYFIDGIYRATGSNGPAANGGRWQVGAINGAVQSPPCYIDSIRITGAIRYPGTASFTPPVF